MRGVALLVETIEKICDRLNPRLEVDGILATMYDGRTLHSREVVRSVVDHFGDQVFHTVISRTVKFPDASAGGRADHDLRLDARRSRGLPAAGPRAHRPRWGGLSTMAEAAMAPLAPLTPPPVDLTPGGVITRRGGSTPFEVHLDVFSGPFDLLLGLISKHKLDITEIALAKVTDEFMAHIRAHQASETDWDLSQASEFLLVAATLLDIKAARLLPPARPAGRGGPRPASRRATCSSPGCCSTARSRTSPRPSPSGWPTAGRMTRAAGRAGAAVRRAAARAGHGRHPRAAGDDRRAGR